MLKSDNEETFIVQIQQIFDIISLIYSSLIKV